MIEAMEASDFLHGTVIAVQANFYRVKLDQTESAVFWDNGIQPCQRAGDTGFFDSVSELLCTRRALLKKLGQSVVVGDRVLVEDPDWAGERGAICQVFPRKSQLSRPPVANADQVLLLFSLAQPDLDPFQLTKFLLTAEQTGMTVLVGLSKADLVDEQTQQSWCDRLTDWGYSAIAISLKTMQGIDHLTQQLHQKLTVLSGPSGVGKSSLINSLIPDLNVRVGAVSQKWNHGRHTTRHVELFDLPNHGLLADSPGFNQPSLEISPHHLSQLFPEIRQMLKDSSCQFKDCLHQNEPNCAVHSRWERYEYYLRVLEEVAQKHEMMQQQAKAEQHHKVKAGSDGEITYEPRLAQKKYRRQSRRQQHQSLEDYYSDELSRFKEY